MKTFNDFCCVESDVLILVQSRKAGRMIVARRFNGRKAAEQA
jgi:hypothetical protein